MADPHTATIREGGFDNPTHPTEDRDGCDFDAYLARDFTMNRPEVFGPWKFWWIVDANQEAGGYWNGQHQPEDA